MWWTTNRQHGGVANRSLSADKIDFLNYVSKWAVTEPIFYQDNFFRSVPVPSADIWRVRHPVRRIATQVVQLGSICGIDG